MSILEEILLWKRTELSNAKQQLAADRLAEAAEACDAPTRGFRTALTRGPRPRIVAELKPRSPSRGVIRADFDPVTCAKAYFEAGAAAISVLTDNRYFGGELAHLEIVRSAVPLPLLRKDFVVDAYQIDEARLAGADAVLLIVAAFPGPDSAAEIRRLRQRADSLGLDALVEVHDDREFDIAVASGADLIGINNRDLGTFEVDLEISERLAGRAPDEVVVVAESGIFTAKDVARLESAGADAFLVGEALMREPDPGLALRELRREL
jgi:indole-3-glycerol phosphate synthase